MGSLALLARQAGYQVTGCDESIYPPMSTQLEEQGIRIFPYDLQALAAKPDLFVIGNALSRGNPLVEHVLNQALPYTSGPQFLAESVLPGHQILAVAGTHGKTSTSSMLAWILEYAGLQPGFLIGGIPKNFGLSARLAKKTTQGQNQKFFVIEADEYDTAFFDKRSKFIHYRPQTLILNNLEFDHADIFASLADIQRQFHHLIRTVPSAGHIIVPTATPQIEEVLDQGCWSTVCRYGPGGQAEAEDSSNDSSCFTISHKGTIAGRVHWDWIGQHNRDNALAAIVAAHQIGVPLTTACQALGNFQGVKRRMELLASYPDGVKLYDDFAHHPTAIAATLRGLRARIGDKNFIRAVIEPRSNTMKMGVHAGKLAPSAASASEAVWFQGPDVSWKLAHELEASPVPTRLETDIDALVRHIVQTRRPNEHIVLMSNGDFGGLRHKLVQALGTPL